MARRAMKVPKGRMARMLGLAALAVAAVIAGVFLWRSFSFSEHFDAAVKVSFAPASGVASDATEGGAVRSQPGKYVAGAYKGSPVQSTQLNDKTATYNGEWIQFPGKGDTLTFTSTDTDIPRSVTVMGSSTGTEGTFFLIGGAEFPATPNAVSTITLKDYKVWPFVRVIIRSTWPAQGAVKNQGTATFSDIKQTTTGAPTPPPATTTTPPAASGASSTTPSPAPTTSDAKLASLCTQFCR